MGAFKLKDKEASHTAKHLFKNKHQITDKENNMI